MSEKRTHDDETIEKQLTYKKMKKEPIQNISNEKTTQNNISINKFSATNEKILIYLILKKYLARDDYYSNGDPKNRCVECGVDMGECNPRQYCGKTQCDGYGYVNEDTKSDIENKLILLILKYY